jgi:hypothetical protein
MCSILNPEDYPGTCYTCKNYNDYGLVAGRDGYNGCCKIDGHQTDALVKCKINNYMKK